MARSDLESSQCLCTGRPACQPPLDRCRAFRTSQDPPLSNVWATAAIVGLLGFVCTVGYAAGVPVRILVVEDNPGDADLVRERLAVAKVANRVDVVEDGEQALAYLRQEGEYAEKSRPDLLLLDLNLPRKDGREVLAELKKDPQLQSIPVIVMTSSEAPRDIAQCYALGANAYVAKPVDLTSLERVVRAVEDFWFATVKLPPR